MSGLLGREAMAAELNGKCCREREHLRVIIDEQNEQLQRAHADIVLYRSEADAVASQLLSISHALPADFFPGLQLVERIELLVDAWQRGKQ